MEPRRTQPPDLIEAAEELIAWWDDATRPFVDSTTIMFKLRAAVAWYREQEAEVSSWPGRTELPPLMSIDPDGYDPKEGMGRGELVDHCTISEMNRMGESS